MTALRSIILIFTLFSLGCSQTVRGWIIGEVLCSMRVSKAFMWGGLEDEVKRSWKGVGDGGVQSFLFALSSGKYK